LVSAAAVRCCYPMEADQPEWLPHKKFGLIRRSNRCWRCRTSAPQPN